MAAPIGPRIDQALDYMKSNTCSFEAAAIHVGSNANALSQGMSDQQRLRLGELQGRVKKHVEKGPHSTTTTYTEQMSTSQKAKNVFFRTGQTGGFVDALYHGAKFVMGAPGVSPAERTVAADNFKQKLGLGGVISEHVESSPMTPQKSIELWGFDATSRRAVQEKVADARAKGRNIKARDGSPHEYIVLKNSAIIMIPNGDDSKAYVRTLRNPSTKEGFVGTDFNRALNCLLELYDPICDADGEWGSQTWCIDLLAKQVRVFEERPDDKDIGNFNRGRVLEIDSAHFERCEAQYDIDKNESKNEINNKDVPEVKKKKKNGPANAHGTGGVSPPETPLPGGPGGLTMPVPGWPGPARGAATATASAGRAGPLSGLPAFGPGFGPGVGPGATGPIRGWVGPGPGTGPRTSTATLVEE